jgi:hypothetical protein
VKDIIALLCDKGIKRHNRAIKKSIIMSGKIWGAIFRK